MRLLPNAGAYAVRDLWAHTTTESAGTIAASVPADSAVLYRIAPLHDEVDRYAPLTEVSVDPHIPAAYPGSTYHIAAPGQTIAVAASLRNDGRSALSDATLNLSSDSGWRISGGPANAGAVPAGKTLDGTWQVTVPADASPGTYTLADAAMYQWSDGTQSATAHGTGSFQVLVPPAGSHYLSDLSWLSATNGYGPVLIDRNYYGGPLTIHGVEYAKGLWVNANASIDYYLGGNCSSLTTDFGLDDSDHGTGTVDYQLYADGKLIYDSGVVTNKTPTQHVTVDLTGAHVLGLVVGDAGDGITYDNADIAAPQVTCAG